MLICSFVDTDTCRIVTKGGRHYETVKRVESFFHKPVFLVTGLAVRDSAILLWILSVKYDRKDQ